MLTNKPLIKFVLIFLCTYAAFIVLNEVPFIKKMHHGIFETFGEWVHNTWHPDIKADISTNVEEMGADAKNDYVLTAYSKEETAAIIQHNRIYPNNLKQLKPIAYMAFKARMSHSIATFFLLALILASPNGWKKKLVGCIIGVYLLYILVAMKLTFLLSMADGSKTSDDGIWYFFSGIIGNNESYQELYYILLMCIWILVSISKSSITKLIGKTVA